MRGVDSARERAQTERDARERRQQVAETTNGKGKKKHEQDGHCEKGWSGSC